MPRLLDLECSGCGFCADDVFFMVVPSTILHFDCGGLMEAVLKPRRSSSSQWSDRDAVVVFRDPNGKIRYPMRNDAPTPPGYERVEMRSLAEVNRFEREHGVVNECMHFDRNGKGLDTGDAPAPKLPSEEVRYRNFLRGWNGGT